jgi:hypothetical protein
MYPTPRADQYTLDALKASADIIVEVSALVCYVGFCQPGTIGTNLQKKAMPIWSIMKIEQFQPDGLYPNATETTFANGIMGYNLVWNDYAGYDYSFKTV